MEKIKAIVVEGGAMRGIYSAGVLDALMDNNHYDFKIAVGVSAGSTNLAAYLSKMRGRNLKVITEYATKKEFIDPIGFMKGKDLINLDWLWGETIRDIRLNLEEFEKTKIAFYVGVTDASTGEAHFIRPNRFNLENVIKASSALPMYYRSPISINGNYYFDGGVSAPIPIEKAISLGAQEILVVRSRKKDFQMTKSPIKLEKFFMKEYPQIRSIITNRHEIYNNQVEMLRKNKIVKITELCPPDEFTTKRLTRDKNILLKDYHLGYKDGLEYLKKLGGY
jgi:predicted patatin/cPLA2 family phospholipase